MLWVLRFALSTLPHILRDRQELVLENLALRHQLEVLTRHRSRPKLRAGDRLRWSWLSRSWFGWRSHIVIVQPRHGRALAPQRLAPVLAVEKRQPKQTRSSAHRSRRFCCTHAVSSSVLALQGVQEVRLRHPADIATF